MATFAILVSKYRLFSAQARKYLVKHNAFENDTPYIDEISLIKLFSETIKEAKIQAFCEIYR